MAYYETVSKWESTKYPALYPVVKDKFEALKDAKREAIKLVDLAPELVSHNVVGNIRESI
jgi:hypothetical protein